MLGFTSIPEGDVKAGGLAMTDVSDKVEFYWDPICPWCWITSRWMGDVSRQKDIKVTWKFFSLKMINAERDVRSDLSILHAIGLRALRIAAAVRAKYGNDGVERLYTIMGTAYHHDQEDIDEPDVAEAILQKGEFPPALANAMDDSDWDGVIEADMGDAATHVGNDVGVPIIVLNDGEGPGFFGPVISPAPTGEAAVALWEGLIAVGRSSGFFELKRTREVGPLFGDRPVI